MKWLAPILVAGIPAILLVRIAYGGFVTGEKGLVFVTIAFAIMCILGCWLVIRAVNRKDKELAEKDRPKYPIETVEPPTRSADEQEALREILGDLKKPLQLKTPESKDSTEENQKG